MIRITRTVTVDKPVADVFAYLADFTTTTEWDPGTVQTVRELGDGEVGTTYRNTSRFLGRTNELEYLVIRRHDPQVIVLRGENPSITSLDTIEVREHGTGAEVTYTAEFTFHGIVSIVAPLLRPAFRRLGDHAAAGMQAALERL